MFNHEEKGTIEFKNVSFKYPDAEDDVISNISFTAKPGQTTAFIGSTGSGKSTFARELGKITSYPILHLDKVFHKYPSEIAREKLREATRIFIFQNGWRIRVLG